MPMRPMFVGAAFQYMWQSSATVAGKCKKKVVEVVAVQGLCTSQMGPSMEFLRWFLQ